VRKIRLAVLPALALGIVLAVVAGGSATAAPSDGYATWTFTGATTNFTGTVTLPAGFPAVTLTSTSRTPSPAPISTGVSSWISAATPFGAVFGSSQNKPYLSLRPRADSAGNPSTTTFTFATPTPVGGWGVSLGDVDAERVTVSATDALGAAVPAASLGITTYNYCTPPGASCNNTFVPTATAAGTSVTVEDTSCPAVTARCNTDGESAWINPTVAIKTLTVTSLWKQGFPTFQVWFATVTRAIGGMLSTSCTPTGPLVAQLLDGSGAVVATSAVTAGAFSFPLVAARSDYVVRTDPAALPSGATQSTAAADTSAADATGLAVTSSCAAAPVTPVTPVSPADPAVPTLAATGVVAWPLAAIGSALVIIGVVLRRRRHA
jgi:hypothetical protein